MRHHGIIQVNRNLPKAARKVTSGRDRVKRRHARPVASVLQVHHLVPARVIKGALALSASLVSRGTVVCRCTCCSWALLTYSRHEEALSSRGVYNWELHKSNEGSSRKIRQYEPLAEIGNA
jgi:hypothetical protein